MLCAYKWPFYIGASSATLSATSSSRSVSPTVTSDVPTTPRVGATDGMYIYACIVCMSGCYA